MTKVYSKIGAQLDTPTSDQEFDLGECLTAEDDHRYVYVQASGAITQYWAVHYDENFKAGGVTSTNGAQANGVGFAQSAFTDGQYGWVATHGHNLTVLTKDNTAANAALYTSGSVGILTSVASTGDPLLVSGVRAVSAATSGGGATTIIATYPQLTVHAEPSDN